MQEKVRKKQLHPTERQNDDEMVKKYLDFENKYYLEIIKRLNFLSKSVLTAHSALGSLAGGVKM